MLRRKALPAICSTSTQLPPRLFTDAYCAALARRARLWLVTFDRDFERFERLVLLRLAVDGAG